MFTNFNMDMQPQLSITGIGIFDPPPDMDETPDLSYVLPSRLFQPTTDETAVGMPIDSLLGEYMEVVGTELAEGESMVISHESVPFTGISDAVSLVLTSAAMVGTREQPAAVYMGHLHVGGQIIEVARYLALMDDFDSPEGHPNVVPLALGPHFDRQALSNRYLVLQPHRAWYTPHPPMDSDLELEHYDYPADLLSGGSQSAHFIWYDLHSGEGHSVVHTFHPPAPECTLPDGHAWHGTATTLLQDSREGRRHPPSRDIPGIQPENQIPGGYSMISEDGSWESANAVGLLECCVGCGTLREVRVFNREAENPREWWVYHTPTERSLEFAEAFAEQKQADHPTPSEIQPSSWPL